MIVIILTPINITETSQSFPEMLLDVGGDTGFNGDTKIRKGEGKTPEIVFSVVINRLKLIVVKRLKLLKKISLSGLFSSVVPKTKSHNRVGDELLIYGGQMKNVMVLMKTEKTNKQVSVSSDMMTTKNKRINLEKNRGMADKRLQ
jgi:hypothetical protein